MDPERTGKDSDMVTAAVQTQEVEEEKLTGNIFTTQGSKIPTIQEQGI